MIETPSYSLSRTYKYTHEQSFEKHWMRIDTLGAGGGRGEGKSREGRESSRGPSKTSLWTPERSKTPFCGAEDAPREVLCVVGPLAGHLWGPPLPGTRPLRCSHYHTHTHTVHALSIFSSHQFFPLMQNDIFIHVYRMHILICVCALSLYQLLSKFSHFSFWTSSNSLLLFSSLGSFFLPAFHSCSHLFIHSHYQMSKFPISFSSPYIWW